MIVKLFVCVYVLIPFLFVSCSTTGTDNNPPKPVPSPSIPIPPPEAIPKPPSLESLVKNWTIPKTGKQFNSLIGMKGIGTIKFFEQENQMEVRLPLEWEQITQISHKGKTITANAIKRAYSYCKSPQLRYTFVRNNNSIVLYQEDFYCDNHLKNFDNKENDIYLTQLYEDTVGFNAYYIDRFSKANIKVLYRPPMTHLAAATSVIATEPTESMEEAIILQIATSVGAIIGNILIPKHQLVCKDNCSYQLSNMTIDSTHYFTGRRLQDLYKKRSYYEEPWYPFEKAEDGTYVQDIQLITGKTHFDYAKIVIDSDDFLSPKKIYIRIIPEEDRIERITPEQFNQQTGSYVE